MDREAMISHLQWMFFAVPMLFKDDLSLNQDGLITSSYLCLFDRTMNGTAAIL